MNREHLAPSYSSATRGLHALPERESVAVISAARGCGHDAAFDELIDVAMRHHVSVGCAAESLISLVGDVDGGTDGPVIVPLQWVELRSARETKSRTAGACA